MQRTTKHYTIKDQKSFKSQLLTWSIVYREVVFLDTNQYTQKHTVYDAVLAADAFTSILTDYTQAFEKLKEYQLITKDWLFGYLSYDLKNTVENLSSQNYDGLQFPDLFFFQPQKIIFIKENQVTFEYLNCCADEIETDFNSILNSESVVVEKEVQTAAIQQRISKEDYLKKVNQLKEYIQRGDVYEVNFCMEFFKTNAAINPYAVFEDLNSISQAPFSVFLKNNKHYLLSASPERYVQKIGSTVISQPIKGTAPRNSDPIQDNQNKLNLVADVKERSENIMITDLVRNDLSRTAQKGSVAVTELCEVKTFLQVHQMISTITAELDEKYTPVSVLETTFPMGSMTGAPKIAAMKLIEQLEETKRGLYSGAVGYFTPEGDFDFNVVIRSILYNQKNKYVSFSVGSAITALSIPEQEYEECLLKANAMMRVLGEYSGNARMC